MHAECICGEREMRTHLCGHNKSKAVLDIIYGFIEEGIEKFIDWYKKQEYANLGERKLDTITLKNRKTLNAGWRNF